MGVEVLEDRILLASDFQLAAVQTSDSGLLTRGDTITNSPSEVTLVFTPGTVIDATTLGGIEVIGSGGDGNFTNGNETNFAGFVGVGAEPNEVVVRFSSPLTDDAYRLVVPDTVRNDCNMAFNGGIATTISFDLDLAPRVLAVVPQPVNVGNGISHSRNTIDVYFNNDDLNVSLAENPDFYQLYFTQDTASNLDDLGPFKPVSVAYDAIADKATLQFATDIEDLPNELDPDVQINGNGSYRLRIGSTDTAADAPITTLLEDDPGETAGTASNALADIANGRPIIITNEISPLISADGVVLPGSETDPGHRLVNSIVERHVAGEDDNKRLIEVINYNFREVYGVDQFGEGIQNSITDQQKQRAREVLELYSYYLGVQFIETDTDGFTIATGDVNGVQGPFGADASTIQSGATGTSTIMTGNVAQEIDVVVMNGATQWGENYGEDWFQNVAVQIGYFLGYGTAWDLPTANLFGSAENLELGREPEQVFPGPQDIIHGQFLFNPNSNDVDMYRIDVTEPGKLTAETFAERGLGSSLDTVLRLFRQAGPSFVPVAQNDNYFGSDSLLDVTLEPGTYFIGVSSRGNDQYDARIESGLNGTTQGQYELRVQFESTVGNSLTDLSGQRLDGDADGTEGGDYDFWFRATQESNTIYVQKGGSSTGSGTLLSPYNNIRTAMEAAQPGDIVRVVANSVDGDPSNDVPFEIGFDNLGAALDDGSTDGVLRVKQDVVLMIDAGSVFKLHNGAILVGSDSAIVDRGGSSIQVLGTPEQSVIFTSINDNTVGIDIDPLDLSASRGDWGGIEIRRDRDNEAGRLNYENEAIFLDYINYATMRYGGGVLQLDSARAVSPISMTEARPTVTNNLITNNSDAAMSASPNAFRESLFTDPDSQSVAFSPEYRRVGPDIHGNTLTDNTINGLFIVDRSGFSTSQLELTSATRWDDTDIVHVVADSLVVRGRTGGVQRDSNGLLVGRSAGSLRIDPSMVVKLDNGRIEVGFGASIIAEGTPENPVIFTSLNDDRFGTGGTFDTSDNQASASAAPGDWGGIMVRPIATGSFDNAIFAFGGGNSTIAGGFASFNVIEVHQSKVRVANSVFESNATGASPNLETNRVGRGFNEEGTIYVRGAQPIVVDNVFRSNLGSAINIDVNSLNSTNVFDIGPSTGLVALGDVYRTNQGPLVRNNVLDSNGTNGMNVRGGVLSTEGVWDDTDIVHVLKDNVYIPNFHSKGGLSLKSSPDQSLVVKSLGELAGFVTTGTSIGIPDHIGGSLQVLGQPGNPVILTSLYDDTVGAGVDLNGQTQLDTDGGGRPSRTTAPGVAGSTQIVLNFGPQIQAFPEVRDAARLAADVWEENLQDDVTIVIDIDLSGDLSQTPITGFPGAGVLSALNQDNFDGDVAFLATDNADANDTFTTTTDLFATTTQFASVAYDTVQGALVSDAGGHETLAAQIPTGAELQVDFPTSTQVPFATSPNMRVSTANAKALGLNFGTAEGASDGQILITDNLDLFDFDRSDGLYSYREDFQTQFMTQIGEILGFHSSMSLVGLSLDNPDEPTGELNQTMPIELTPLDLFRFAPGEAQDDFTSAPRLLNPAERDQVFYAGGDLDFRAYEYEGMVRGEIPLSTGGGNVRGQEFANDNNANRWRDEIFFRNGDLTNLHTIGLMDPHSILRDQVIQYNDPVVNTHGMIINLSEADLLAFDSIGWDVAGGAPGDWSGIRMEELTYDGNVELITELESGAETNSLPATAQFLGGLAENRNAGNEELRLGFEVHGAIANTGDIDLYRFQAVAGTDIWIDIDSTGSTLDSTVALVASDQSVLARSNSTVLEQANPSLLTGLGQPFDSPDLYTYSQLDAGLKVTLPGSAGSQGFFYVAVQSEDAASEGRYELQIRLRETDEVPGSAVQFADIRYAETGVLIVGPPSDSPLLGEQAEDESLNDFFAEGFVTTVNDQGFGTDKTFNQSEMPFEVSAQRLGQLGTTRQGAISVFGTLSDDFGFATLNGDVDWYSFEIIATDTAVSDMGLVFDIDYADGIGGPDTVLAVYRQGTPDFGIFGDPFGPNIGGSAQPELVYYSEQSNVDGDRTARLDSEAVVTGGSFGSRDPYIGPIAVSELAGDAILASGTYYVAISSIANIPSELIDAQNQLGNRDLIFDPVDQNNLGRGGARNDVLLAPTGVRNSWLPNPDAPAGAVVSGEYQLEIRAVPLPGAVTNLDPDLNRERTQGQLLISNNSITDSRQFGISIVDAYRDPRVYGFQPTLDEVEVNNYGYSYDSTARRAIGQSSAGDWIPHTGAPRALPGLNEERVIPGITIANNVISSSMEGGIELQGDPGGIVLDVYDICALVSHDGRGGNTFEAAQIDNASFSVWDHQGQTQTFQFTLDDTADPGKIPIRFDSVDATCPGGGNENRFLIEALSSTLVPRPTETFHILHEIAHAIRLSDLDIDVHVADTSFTDSVTVTYLTNAMGETDTIIGPGAPPQIFIEGASQIGLQDLNVGTTSNAFSPPRSAFPIITANFAQQGAVPYARIVNNTVVGRGGDLFDGNGVGDVGIVIEDNASPTLLNNIVSNFDIGVRSDFSANDSEIERGTYVGSLSSVPQANFSTIYVAAPEGDSTLDVGGGGYGYVAPFDSAGLFRELDASPTPYMGARPTVVGAMVYQGNQDDTVRIGTGSFASRLNNNEPLFVDAAGGNFFLAEGSMAIDSSIDSLPERDYISEVLNSAGISSTDIGAPDIDAVGILRVDDPSVEPPSGFGSNVFKDRGALERGDFVGPTASLLTPADNVAPDGNPADNIVTVFRSTLTFFEIKLSDGATLSNPVFGSGIDDTSVIADAIIVRRDDTILQAGTDYTISYDPTKNALRILPVVGVWTRGDYELELSNGAGAAIQDLSGNTLRPNLGDGRTAFQISIDTASSNPWRNPVNEFDVNGDGNGGGDPAPVAVPIDALIVINELNDPEFSDATTGALPSVAVFGDEPRYLDVNGDGFVSPIDALLIINRLNDQSNAAQAAMSSVVTFAGQGFDVGATDEDEKDEAHAQDNLLDFDGLTNDFAEEITAAWRQ